MHGVPPGNNPEAQVPTSSLADATAMSATAIPVQAVDADQLPREKGWTYEEMASIVGSLYLDSTHQLKVREEQFSAVISEYDKRIMQMQAMTQTQQEEIDGLRKQIATLSSELEVRNESLPGSHPGSSSTSGNDRSDALSDS